MSTEVTENKFQKIIKYSNKEKYHKNLVESNRLITYKIEEWRKKINSNDKGPWIWIQSCMFLNNVYSDMVITSKIVKMYMYLKKLYQY